MFSVLKVHLMYDTSYIYETCFTNYHALKNGK